MAIVGVFVVGVAIRARVYSRRVRRSHKRGWGSRTTVRRWRGRRRRRLLRGRNRWLAGKAPRDVDADGARVAAVGIVCTLVHVCRTRLIGPEYPKVVT